MIQIFSDIVDKSECEKLIQFYENNKDRVVSINSDMVYHFDGITLIDNLNDFSFFKKIKLNPLFIDRVRVQHVNEQTNFIEEYHTDKEPFTFIVFLNNNFDGGELTYENILVKPKIGQLIYSTGDEPHYVKKVTKGDRYTLVCFLKQNLEFGKLKKIL